jgi:hypothetical protein
MRSPVTAKAPLEGTRVIILKGDFAGEEGVCVGATAAPRKWAVSPDCSDSIVSLEFEREFALLVDLSLLARVRAETPA